MSHAGGLVSGRMETLTMKTHEWKHAPRNTDAFWKCQDCGKLDFAAIPDTSPTCAGSISKRIEREIKEAERPDSTYTQEYDDFTDAGPGL